MVRMILNFRRAHLLEDKPSEKKLGSAFVFVKGSVSIKTEGQGIRSEIAELPFDVRCERIVWGIRAEQGALISFG